MGRRKKEAIEPDIETKEPREIAPSNSEELDELEATTNTEEVEEEALGHESRAFGGVKAETPKRRRRTPRVRKPPTLPLGMECHDSKAHTPTTTCDFKKEVSEGNQYPEEENAALPDQDCRLREDAAMAEVSVQKSMESMVKQWGSVKEISGAVCTNLDRVATMLSDMQTRYSQAMLEVQKVTPQRNSIVHKITMGASAAAMVLSLVSLALSQSARQAILDKELSRRSSLFLQATQTTATQERPVVTSPRTVEASPTTEFVAATKALSTSAAVAVRPKEVSFNPRNPRLPSPPRKQSGSARHRR